MKAGENRQRIVSAASYLFSERGYADTSIADIAAHAGLLKGNLSYYFTTKAALLECVTQAHKKELISRLTSRLHHDASAQEAIEQFLQTIEDSASELARIGCPVGTLCSELGKDDSVLQPHAAHILETLRQWLAQQFGRIVTPAAAQDHTEHLLSMMQGAAVLAHTFRDPDLVLRRVSAARDWLRTI